MKIRRAAVAAGIMLSVSVPATRMAYAHDGEDGHAVFVMTNDAGKNEVIAYERTAYGTLQDAQRYSTDGRGSGGTVDPLASQGSLTLSADHSWLFAVNAGSGTVSAFRVEGSRLHRVDRIATEGSEPNSVTQHGNLVYVLNTAGSSSVVGFYFEDGKFQKIQDSIRYLSANAVGSGSVAFSPNGKYLMVTEKATNVIDVFKVLGDGTLSPITTNRNVGAGTFSAGFAPDGVAIVAETGPSAAGTPPNSSAVSSYAIQPDGSLKVISASIPTLGGANCWSAVTPDGRFVYTSNSASSSIAGFAIGANGALTPLPGTVVGLGATGSVNIDLAVSEDGKFLYTLNAGNGSIGVFGIDGAKGGLTNLGALGGLPAAGGLNGIAAN